MSQAIRRLSALRRELHQLKAHLRTSPATTAEQTQDLIDGILQRDQDRIEHRGQG